MAEVSKNIKAPKSAYEFENSWRSFSGDRALQTQLLKVWNSTCKTYLLNPQIIVPLIWFVNVLGHVSELFTSDFQERLDFSSAGWHNKMCSLIFHVSKQSILSSPETLLKNWFL